MTDALQDLRDKVAAGVTGAWTFDALGDGEDFALDAFHGSLDAAKELHETALPGWVVGIHKPPDHGNRAKCALFWIVNLGSADGKVEIDSVIGADPARAWLLAILDALIQGDKADG